MKTGTTTEQLVRWRFAGAEAEAGPPPCAAQLLKMTRPWWEVWPGQFHALIERLGQMQVAYGHAMEVQAPANQGHLVAALVVGDGKTLETYARMVYLKIRDRQLLLRFQLTTTDLEAKAGYEVTLVANDTSQPLLSVAAVLTLDNEYRMEAAIPEQLVREWGPLKVSEKMPFRLILRDDLREV